MIRGWLESAGAAALGFLVTPLLLFAAWTVLVGLVGVALGRQLEARACDRRRARVRAATEQAVEERVVDLVPGQRDGER